MLAPGQASAATVIARFDVHFLPLRSQPRIAGVQMLRVVPCKEGLAELAGVFDAAEAVGEFGSVFQGLELAFRVWVVVGDMGAAIRFGDAEIADDIEAGRLENGRSRRRQIA